MNLRRLIPVDKPKPVVEEKKKTTIDLRDKHVCVTGKIKTWTRNMIHNWLLCRGSIIDNTVTRRTDYLLQGKNPGATKIKAARNNKTKILKVEDLDGII